MNTLFITHHYLSSNGGGSFASRAYINAFAELSSEMTLLYPVKDGEELFEGINPKIKTISVAYNIPKWKKLYHLLTGKVHRYFKAARTILNQDSFDIVVFDTSVVSYKLVELFKETGAKIIVIHHNYQYEYFRDNTSWWLKWPTLYWCKRYEEEAVRKADLNLTLTKQDIELLSKHYCNGDVSKFKLLGTFEYKTSKPVEIDPSTPNLRRFVITGNLGAMQTKQSLVPWIREYYPILKEVFPDATLTIAGKGPDEGLTDLCKKNSINLIPNPETMDSILKNSDYYICPICFGGGLKLRVMDGLKWGLPVIAHKVSARGYDEFIEKGYMFSYYNEDNFKILLHKLISCNSIKHDVCKCYHEIFSFDEGIRRTKGIISEL